MFGRGSHHRKFRNGWFFYRDREHGFTVRGVIKKVTVRTRPPELLVVEAWSMHVRDNHGNDTSAQSAPLALSLPLEQFRGLRWEHRTLYETEFGDKCLWLYSPSARAPWEITPEEFFGPT